MLYYHIHFNVRHTAISVIIVNKELFFICLGCFGSAGIFPQVFFHACIWLSINKTVHLSVAEGILYVDDEDEKSNT